VQTAKSKTKQGGAR